MSNLSNGAAESVKVAAEGSDRRFPASSHLRFVMSFTGARMCSAIVDNVRPLLCPLFIISVGGDLFWVAYGLNEARCNVAEGVNCSNRSTLIV